MTGDLAALERELLDLGARSRALLEAAATRNLALAAAESCTGGLIAATLTGIEGVSSCFRGGFVTYCNEAKTAMLGIPAADIERFGVVSPQIAVAMARQARILAGADLAVGVTGFTGDAGEDNENGLVHIAVAHGDGDLARELHFGDVERNEGRAHGAAAALDLLREAVARF
ncbi:CinA family protein [Alteraurantiacibacter buctensis]|uniref:Nicotinamide-nucleotide amidohydrolase family protein n=1 Tax=Alteraurantiacibacter buctensis TaxID=1503981 RepID=A0A844YVE4_9SPHN|nr:nicotinamide-nucleotide amidohydrolase family protein [Alteraurantiacibacter buctensis]MXO71016.1 nicotinamide-nucleotide amidohydrolase family protein [Alteraurantiacibacter buctensis]